MRVLINFLFAFFFVYFSGLHLRSIEEPSAVSSSTHHLHHHHQHHHHQIYNNNCRMPAEQGGTGYGSEQSLLGSRAGVPLPLQNAAHHPLTSNNTTSNSNTSTSHHSLSHSHHHHHAHHQQQQQLQNHHKGYDAEHARMEAWMDENQEFVQDYFIR